MTPQQEWVVESLQETLARVHYQFRRAYLDFLVGMPTSFAAAATPPHLRTAYNKSGRLLSFSCLSDGMHATVGQSVSRCTRSCSHQSKAEKVKTPARIQIGKQDFTVPTSSHKYLWLHYVTDMRFHCTPMALSCKGQALLEQNLPQLLFSLYHSPFHQPVSNATGLSKDKFYK